MSSLRVEKSALQARWVFPNVNDNEVENFMKAHQLPEFIARLLVSRHVTPDRVQSFLYPKLATDFPNPFAVKDMGLCAEFLADAIESDKKFSAFCDFDVDGSTSAALLKKFFRHLGLDIPLYIPDRFVEGYGPNAKSLSILKEQGADIVLMADCGTTAFDVLQHGKDIGLDIVVLDHHEQAEELPICRFLINPKRKDDSSGYHMLAACGVTFLMLVALNRTLKDRKFYEQRNLSEPPLKSWLDLVALGTVCDMVPLTGCNRLLVRTGFEQMAQGLNVGLKALCAVSNLKKPPTPEDAGFMLGPRINAGSRVHQSDLGAKLLSSDNEEEAQNLAWILNDCNAKRKSLQTDMLKQATAQVERFELYRHPIILVHDEAWHVGLNGLVAGQLKEKYGKPACVIAYAPNMAAQLEGRGSGRSVKGFNLAALFMAAKEKDLLVKGGGHAMAAGFTVEPDKISSLYEFFISEAANQDHLKEFVLEEHIDSLASLQGAKIDLIKMLDKYMGPFGQENPVPQFALADVRINSIDIVGDTHIRMMISDLEGGQRMKAMAFKAVDTDLGDVLFAAKNKTIHLLGQFKINNWQDRETVEFHVTDAATG
jgi:single-stranded-DNA-specific exonuclease